MRVPGDTTHPGTWRWLGNVSLLLVAERGPSMSVLFAIHSTYTSCFMHTCGGEVVMAGKNVRSQV